MQEQIDIATLLQQRQNEFIEKRTIIEAEVNKFLKGLANQDEATKKNLSVQENSTAKDWLPSLWIEPFDFEKYQGELANLNNYIAKARAYADELAEEARACLQQ